jgi:hypothetical protein
VIVEVSEFFDQRQALEEDAPLRRRVDLVVFEERLYEIIDKKHTNIITLPLNKVKPGLHPINRSIHPGV